jgi:hypothetical protein
MISLGYDDPLERRRIGALEGCRAGFDLPVAGTQNGKPKGMLEGQRSSASQHTQQTQ